ncbi:major facilitator superfamily domain-containing protein [Podospora conica]|nr:major facilitator superfamily domain-containing protein [Schizothecium conicum]
MREASGHAAVNGDQALDDIDAFSDTDSEKSLLSDSDAPASARGHPRENSQPLLPRAEHEPRPGSSIPESDGCAEAQLPVSNEDAVHVSWRDLPRKDQLIVITLARLSEPLVQTSLQSYMFYMLKWFDPELSDAVISSQAGILHASFTAAQFLTAMMWGRIADSRRFGRKTVLMIGLAGTFVSCIGFGFSTSFYQALFFRALGGITNGNIGVLRTMISETIKEKKYQSRAFLILPMTFNIGIIIGPVLGGVLSDPANSYPSLFGNVEFLKRHPYAAPNLLSAFFLLCAVMAVWMCLEETLDSRLDCRDRGIELRHTLTTFFSRTRPKPGYAPLSSRDASTSLEIPSLSPTTDNRTPTTRPRPRFTRRLPFTLIFTPNVVLTLVASFLLALHVGTFNSLWFIFLSTPVYDPSHPPPASLPRHPPFLFTGGLGLHPQQVGFAMATLGTIGIALQLLLYPYLSARLGTLLSWRVFLAFFPLAYFAVPFLSLVPSATEPPAPKSGVQVWVSIAGVLALQVVGRTFALPAQTILVNNCTPHPSVLGTVHGVGQSVSSFARTVGPVVGGVLYGLGLEKGVVGGVWWGLSAVAVGGFVASFFVREGSGHEIWLEGDEEEG